MLFIFVTSFSVTATAQLVPSDLMENCKQWKITYPTGEEDKTLCDEPNNEFFFVNDSGDAIVFHAPIRNDNGTTPNSSNIRSELRERVQDGSVDIYWTTEGTHMIYVKQAITHLPINKSQLVATQIHGNKDDGIDDSMVMRLEDSHLFLSFNGGKLREDVTIKTNYSLGTIHEVIFLVVDGKHYCYYAEDGNLLSAYNNNNATSYLVKDGGNDYVMDLDYDESYFKVGNYTQSNADEEGDDTDDPNNYGEVLVYDFSVKHDEVSVTGVDISPSSVDLLIDASVQLSATVKPLTATNIGVTYVSDNPSIASVDSSSGLVTAISEGTAIITVTTEEGSFTAESIITVVKPYDGANLALNKSISTSGTHDGDYVPANLVDGSTATKWSASGFPQTAIIDLGSIYALERTEMICHNDRDYQFNISVSNTENGTFTQIVDRSTNTTPGTITYPIIDTFNAVDGRFVKITITGAATYTGTWMSLLEFRIFGDSTSGNDTDTDGDGILDINDNCPEISNPDQKDSDNNGIGDVCDTTIIEDSDADGILDANDKCSNTPSGDAIDTFGCTLLSSNNFTIETISETCQNKNNGELIISAKEDRNYQLTINGEIDNFTTTKTISNLSPGIYDICIEVVGNTSPYCYSVEIKEGATISGKSSLKNKQLEIEVSKGTLPYEVFVNGTLQFMSSQNKFHITVDHGDIVEVKTAKACEGIYTENIQLLDNLTVYPNPSEGFVTIAIPTTKNQVHIQVFNQLSQEVIAGYFEVHNSMVQIDLTNKPIGVYFVKLFTDQEYIFKVVKK